MSVKTGIDKTVTALENGKEKISNFYDTMSGLSVKNKANFDIQVTSDGKQEPVCMRSYGYSREFKVKHLFYAAVGIAALFVIFRMLGRKS